MLTLDNLVYALHGVFQPAVLLAMLAGSIIGVIVGALPGASATMALAVMIPVTFWFPEDVSLLMLISVYCSGVFGGSISACLLNIPGTPASAATCFDGNPLTKQGMGGKAVLVALVASTFGGIISGIALLFCAPALAALALKFGAPETMMVALFGLTMVASLSSDNLIKGLMMGAIGMLIGTIGLSPAGTARFTFGNINLYGGLQTVPILIGVFSIPEVIRMVASSGWKMDTKNKSRMRMSWKELKSIIPTCSVSTVVGLIIGLIPAIGPETATFIGYDRAKKMAKEEERETFGKGNIKGVAASESANNAVCGTSLAPMFALGIPGSGAAMVLMGGLMIHGLTPGPTLFREEMPLLTTIFLGFILAQIFMLVIGYGACRLAPHIFKAHHLVLAPIILIVCMVGTFATNNSLFDVFIMLGFGVAAYFLGNAGYSCVPMVLGMLLGKQFETNLARTLVLSQKTGFLSFFFTRPIAILLAVLTLLTIVLPIIMERRKKARLDKLAREAEIAEKNAEEA